MIGRTISHYRILEKLGEGGTGVVFKAHDARRDRPVALKFLHAQELKNERIKARFFREAKTAGSLDHPNICPVHEIVQEEDLIFLAMPWIEGESLRERMATGAMRYAQALDIAVQIGRGLEAAHASGIIHRDIKSDNVLITPDGTAKILDFGLAMVEEGTGITQASMMVGTVAYVSPEIALGRKADARADVWSLGVCLYEMMAGERPFRGENDLSVLYSIVNQAPEPVTTYRPNAPIEIQRLLERLLAKSPDDRFPDMVGTVAALEEVSRKLGGTTLGESGRGRAARSP